MTALQMKNIDYTVFPSDAVKNFVCENGKLKNILTGQEYSLFILPMCQVIPLAAARLLELFVNSGGRLLIMDALPEYAMSREEDGQVREIFREMLKKPGVTFMENICDAGAAAAWLEENLNRELEIISGIRENKSTCRYYPSWVIDPYIHDGEDMDGIYYCCYGNKVQKLYFMVNYTRDIQTLTVKLHGPSAPEIWDPMTGEIKGVRILEKKGSTCLLEIQLPAGYGIFLVTAKEHPEDISGS